MVIQVQIVRLTDGTIGRLVYLVEEGVTTLLPYHLSWNGRSPFSINDVKERLGTEIIDQDW